MLRVHGQEEAEHQVQPGGQHAAPHPERTADQQHREGLAGQRHRAAGDEDSEVGREGDEQGAGHDEGDVADPGTDAFADLDRYEEIGDRDTALAGGRPIESGQGDRQLRLPKVGRAFGDRRPESSIRSPDGTGRRASAAERASAAGSFTNPGVRPTTFGPIPARTPIPVTATAEFGQRDGAQPR